MHSVPNALLPREEHQDNCQFICPLPLMLMCLKGPGALFLCCTLFSSHSIVLSFQMPLAAFDDSPLLVSQLGKLWFATFPCSFPTSLMVQESLWMFLCSCFTLYSVMSNVLRK